MKRYWLFQWNFEKADGGMNDLKGTFDSVDEAKGHEKRNKNHKGKSYSCAEIADSSGWKVVCHKFLGSNWRGEEPLAPEDSFAPLLEYAMDYENRGK